jgi:hypothetical protein
MASDDIAAMSGILALLLIGAWLTASLLLQPATGD